MTTTLIILVITVALFIWGRVRADIVALTALAALLVLGILTPAEALAGFSSPIVIMMIGLFEIVVMPTSNFAGLRIGDANLRKRFGIAEKSDHTLEEVGKLFNVTRERIRQIEAKALRKLRHPVRSQPLRSYYEN